MPVMGPTYTDDQVDRIYKSVLCFLRENWNIQTSRSSILWDWTEDREERNALLKEAIRGLVELESWESF